MNSYFTCICCKSKVDIEDTELEKITEYDKVTEKSEKRELSYISLLIPFDIIDDIENTEKEIDELNKISFIFWSVYNGN